MPIHSPGVKAPLITTRGSIPARAGSRGGAGGVAAHVGSIPARAGEPGSRRAG